MNASVLYFIKDVSADASPYVKIGVTNNVLSRLVMLQIGHPGKLAIVRLLIGNAKDEKALHLHYAHKKLRGEWFLFSDDMLTENTGLTDTPIPLTVKLANKARRTKVISRQRARNLRSELLPVEAGSVMLLVEWLVYQDWTNVRLGKAIGVSREMARLYRVGLRRPEAHIATRITALTSNAVTVRELEAAYQLQKEGWMSELSINVNSRR